MKGRVNGVRATGALGECLLEPSVVEALYGVARGLVAWQPNERAMLWEDSPLALASKIWQRRSMKVSGERRRPASRASGARRPKADALRWVFSCTIGQLLSPTNSSGPALEIAPEVDHAIVDRLKLREAVGDLLRNALAALPEYGGRLGLRSRLSEDGTDLLIEVADEGGGAEQSLIDEAFAPTIDSNE